MHSLGGTLGHGQALAVLMDGNRRLVAVLHRPDDVGWSPRRVAAEEHARAGGFVRDLVDHRHVVLVEPDADVALDPGEGVVLPDGENDLVAWNDHRTARRVELHAGE